MPMDGLMLGYLARELQSALAGGRVDKITQPEQDEIVLVIRSQGKNCPLLLTASPNSARAQLTQMKKNNPLEPPTFCMLLRKHLSGARGYVAIPAILSHAGRRGKRISRNARKIQLPFAEE